MREGTTKIPGAMLLALAVALGGCGQSREEAACNDTVDTFADALERCGETGGLMRADLEREIEESATMGQGCDRVVSIRDEDALRELCLPGLQVIDCAALGAADLPASCREQLVVRVP